MKREQTIQRRTFGNLRGEVNTIMSAIDRNPGKTSPYAWDRLMLRVIDNTHRAPAKYKLPQIDIILRKFEELQVEKVNSRYLSKLYDTASIRRHQGNGKKVWLMRKVYGELLSAVEAKMYEKTDSDGQVKIRPTQPKLLLEVRSASKEK